MLILYSYSFNRGITLKKLDSNQMKVKEIPVSLYQTFKLLFLPKDKLKVPKGQQENVVVSFTSIPSRIHILHIVVRSLLNQSIQPKKIILWLHNDLKGNLPKKLTQLESDIFEIHFSELTCSHRKLVLSLEKFPDCPIITCDDDVIYHSNWLELLWKDHQKFPNQVIANQVRYIQYDESGNLLPYKKWNHKKGEEIDPRRIVPIGVAGVLYPVDSLSKKVVDKELFLKLTPSADDLWFKAMSLLKNTDSKLSEHNPKKPIPILNSQKESLKRKNVDKDKNREQWLAVSKFFNINLNDKEHDGRD